MQSRLYLPKLDNPPAKIVDYLAARFPQVPLSIWRDRLARGLVTTGNGERLQEDSPYRYGSTVFYVKEVPSEPEPLDAETILYQDDELLAADKPHGMAVTPAGEHIARCLLNRLKEQTGIDSLVPLHRLDRDTAGIVLFGIRTESRGRYQQLFEKGSIRREYFAVARMPEVPEKKHWLVENRLGTGTPWFRQQILAEGKVNATTEIELLDTREDLALFRLIPHTGKKHQLRLHLSSIGFPILGDPLYPEMRINQEFDPPLQLLAARLTFTDPHTGQPRDFRSTRQLRYPFSVLERV